MNDARPWRGKKLVLAVIDGMKPSMLEQAVEEGRAPALERLMRDGVYVDDCVAAFPSLTPVCTATIATGVGPDHHLIPGMNWYHRDEQRYVEYGSSFQASRVFGIQRSMTDTVYNLNLSHLSRDVPTVFEALDDAGVWTAGTTFLIYRGRHRQEASSETALARIATFRMFPHAVYGPRELFYADLFASQRTGCRSQLGLPGARDSHAGCVAAYMVERDLFDFLLLSLPDNDTVSHRAGPEGQVASIARADRQLTRMMDAAGGADAFLDDYAVIVMGDHSHSEVRQRMSLAEAFDDWSVLVPNDPHPDLAEIAVSPGQRSAMLYVLGERQRARRVELATRMARQLPGVDLVVRRRGEEVEVWSERGTLRFAPDGGLRDVRGGAWSVDGDLAALAAVERDGILDFEDYPDALARLWEAASCPTAGDILISAARGWEFVDWGGGDHIGGGSHGALDSGDSLGALLFCGTGPPNRDARAQWTLRDVAPIVHEHFDLVYAADRV